MVVWGIGIPVMWVTTGEKFETTGAIRISPMVSRILFPDSDPDRSMPTYENLMNTEAGRIAGNTVLNRVADELSGKKLMLFEDSADPVLALREAVTAGGIEFATEPRSELIKIRMLSKFPAEAEQIIDAFMQSYMNVVKAEEGRSDDNKLSVLDEKKRTLNRRISTQAKEINNLLEEFGTEELDRYDTETIGMGRKQLNIDDKKAELERTRELYNNVCNRISKIEMAQKRPARISIAEMARSVPSKDYRKEMTPGIVFAGLLLGIVFAMIPGGKRNE